MITLISTSWVVAQKEVEMKATRAVCSLVWMLDILPWQIMLLIIIMLCRCCYCCSIPFEQIIDNACYGANRKDNNKSFFAQQSVTHPYRIDRHAKEQNSCSIQIHWGRQNVRSKAVPFICSGINNHQSIYTVEPSRNVVPIQQVRTRRRREMNKKY